ncbi:MAG: hypothetical protein ACP5U2_06180, partial [Bryobacteraceae bacterium]
MRAVREWTRRTWMAGAACAAMPACRRPQRVEPKPVLVARVTEYSQSLYDTVRRMLAELKLDVRGKRVVLKPNLVEIDERTTINTNPLVVHA